MGKDVIIRIPLIPGFNDDMQNLRATAEFVCELGKISEVHILPYHQLGISKYPLMGYAYPLPDLKPPKDHEVQAAAQVFNDYGLRTQIHG